MTEQNPASVDDISVQKPAVADVEASADPPLAPGTPEGTVQPLDLDPPKVRSKLRIYSILVALYLVLFIAALDQTIVATSVPAISASLHSASGYVWIGGAYLLANAAAGPLWAKCSDIWGRKPALLGAVGIFAGASIIAALSVNMPMLIAARALQGTSGGGLIQLVTITISDLFSLRNRPLYIGLLGLMWAVAGAAGPLIGGAFTTLVDWRWCFWINLPICGGAFVLLLLFLDVHNPHTKLRDGIKAVDWFGTLSMLGVTLMILLGLNFGGAIFPWDSPKVICLLVFGTVMVGFFIYSEKRLAKYPLVPLGIFKNWSNNAAFLVAVSHSMVAIGAEYYLPLYFQSVKQASPFSSGLMILPTMITEAAVDILVGVLIHKTGRYREIGWVGSTIMTLGTGLYIMFGTNSTIGHIIGFQIVNGIGTAMLFQAPMISIQNSVSQADTATATATLGFIRNLATSLSLVLGGVVFQNSMAAQQPSLIAAGLSGRVLNALSPDEAAANVEIVQTIQDPAQRVAVQDAFAWSIRNMFIMYTALSAITMVGSFFIKQRRLKTEHTETKTGIENMTKRET
ncbi:MFS drug transporter [Hypomontagnella submonticulosa]|nr:MFS drug transporter [Hypomontagnella submonticulosa]